MYIINGMLSPVLYDTYVVQDRKTHEVMEIRSTRYNEAKHLLLKEIPTDTSKGVVMPNGDLFISGPRKESKEVLNLDSLIEEKKEEEQAKEEKELTELEKVQALFPMSEDKMRKTSKEKLVEMAVTVGLDKAATEALETKKLVVEKIAEKLQEMV